MFRTNRFFTTNKKGEIYELKRELNSEYRHTRSDAVKKVIANMTVGKDVSGLFPDVLKNMQTEDIELKKLVYLYLMNYAKTQPELVILAVNTFVKDSDDPNPLIRALAIRTMGCIRVEKIIDYLTEPLRKCLKDENPYVRKTAAICVAKLFEIAPEMTEEQGFIELLKDMVSDVNPSVVANAVTALMDIHEEASSKGFFKINENVSYKLMHALNECTEWGQIAILSAMVDYRPIDAKDAETICDKVIPRLQHANGAVVLAAVRVLLLNMEYLDDTNKELIPVFCRKMAPPLVTLLSSPPEFQYIALRNISLVLQKFPQVLNNEMRVFFCKYNDPLYVKLEKLEILMKLCNNRNVDQLLSELREYANEVDVEFVRKAVNAIGRCAIKIEEAAERCINVLLDLINTGVSYVVQEAIIVIKDIFRKYPHTFEGIIPQLCSNLDILDEPQAKASLIWIIGEYAEKIDNADDLMTFFIENFSEENAQVQLQLLTATVKLFLKKPSENQGLVQNILQIATEGCDNADIRDRAYIYWRLLSTDPQAAKAVILSEKPPIRGESNELSRALLDNLVSEIGTLASVYHKPADTFLAGKRYGADNVAKAINRHHQLDEEDEEAISAPTAKIKEAIKNNEIGDLLDLDWSEPSVQESPTPAATAMSPTTSTSPVTAAKSPLAMNNSALSDLLSLSIDSPTLQSSQAGKSRTSPGPTNNTVNTTDDIMKLFGSVPTAPATTNTNNNSCNSIPGFNVQPSQPQQSPLQSLSPSLLNMNNTSANNANTTNTTSTASPKKDPFEGLF